MKNIEDINRESAKRILAKKKIPEFSAGDTIKVGVRIVEGKRERIQYFEGVCIAKKNRNINSSFTVRKISFGEGVERTFALYSPIVGSIKVIRSGKVKRAKLYYLRDRKGKSARIAEKIKKKIGIDILEQSVENEIVKEESKEENLIKDISNSLREGKISSQELTKHYLQRIERHADRGAHFALFDKVTRKNVNDPGESMIVYPVNSACWYFFVQCFHCFPFATRVVFVFAHRLCQSLASSV